MKKIFLLVLSLLLLTSCSSVELNPEWYPRGLWKDDIFVSRPNGKFNIAQCSEIQVLFVYKEDNERYIKYVSPDGKREVIFDPSGKVVSADEDIGTYNYADPKFLLEHGLLDVAPWVMYGNTPEDTTERYQRVGGLFNFEE